jgi:hypothetical protein
LLTATGVQLIPFKEYAIGLPADAGVPVNSHALPFHAIPRPNWITLDLLFATAFHVTPLSVEYATDTLVDVPVATNMYPFQAILYAPRISFAIPNVGTLAGS